MFSATMPKRICELAENYMNTPETIRVEGQKYQRKNRATIYRKIQRQGRSTVVTFNLNSTPIVLSFVEHALTLTH